ncbi:alpha/beta hydrolase [Vibrio neptunius]|uniref:Alpha/beta hydrolase n=1 Tax=Vibrio neptunius TaxID=170651 RepID=A0ABS3A0M9_9VIBR|nr:alpha/beta hydrolase [Vibrio neptunius]MBN3492174.1 alpha/beta hydrolase [Vibrio neptunius]MBN3514671.1 alpha/beta hydrolase [Vibrio neptunius]MBN3549203.1 alpha/beta hydrolase [Vibrio neptunius]MBN3576728.1 alpha/beta hydrolase [Vibrio neptunius]MCH9870392.1 alpha/beta hydrolase [Vibrio neptunius]
MSLIRIILLIPLFIVGAAKASSTSHVIERQDGSSLTYYLTRTAQNPSDTLLVIMQGSDCNSVSHNTTINDLFSQTLPEADLLTVEKYGLNQAIRWNPDGDSPDCPTAYIQKDSPTQRAADYQQVLEKLENNYEHIIVLGGSEGAVVAAMVASQVPSVDTLVSLNAGGRFFVDDVLYNMEQTMPPEAFMEAKNGFLGFQQALVSSETMDINMSSHGFAWWKEVLTLDQKSILERVSADTLILQSERDINVSPEQAIRQAEQLMQSRSNVSFVLLAGLDHAFKNQRGESETLSVIKQIQAWLE